MKTAAPLKITIKPSRRLLLIEWAAHLFASGAVLAAGLPTGTVVLLLIVIGMSLAYMPRRWRAQHGVLVLHGDGHLGKVGADGATGKATAQQEGAGQNPARFAVDALQGGRARNAQLCRPGLWPCISFGHIPFGQMPASRAWSALQTWDSASRAGSALQTWDSASRAGLLAVADGDTADELVLHPHTTVLPFLIVLLYRKNGRNGHIGSQVLLGDSFAGDDFRQVRLWLRWRAAKTFAKDANPGKDAAQFPEHGAEFPGNRG